MQCFWVDMCEKGHATLLALEVARVETSPHCFLPCYTRMFLLYLSSLYVMIIALFTISKQCVS